MAFWQVVYGLLARPWKSVQLHDWGWKRWPFWGRKVGVKAWRMREGRGEEKVASNLRGILAEFCAWIHCSRDENPVAHFLPNMVTLCRIVMAVIMTHNEFCGE